MASYVNSFWSRGSLDPQLYSTEAKPIEHRGFLIYSRIKGVCYDIVKDGVCIGQYAGQAGAQRQIDNICDNPSDFWAARALAQLSAHSHTQAA